MYWLMDKTRESKISLYVTLVLFAIVIIFMFIPPANKVARTNTKLFSSFEPTIAIQGHVIITPNTDIVNWLIQNFRISFMFWVYRDRNFFTSYFPLISLRNSICAVSYTAAPL